MSKGWPSGLYFHSFYLASRRPWPWTAGIVARVSLWVGESARGGFWPVWKRSARDG